MIRSLRSLIGVAVGAAVPVVVAVSEPALAACHSFTVEASPSQVDEGGTVTVTVSRDAALNPSQVDVSTVDGTATADQDYPATHRTISFTTEIEQSFSVAITDDAAAEPAETFSFHLSNPSGCPIRPDFQLGPDAPVTIAASDAPAPAPTTSPTSPPAPPTTAVTTAAQGRTTVTTTAPSTSSSSAATATSGSVAADTTSTSGAFEVAARPTDTDSPLSAAVVALALVILAAALAGTTFYLRRRARRT